MTVRIYRSTDASAPTLTGQVGSLTTLFDAVLVNGYGSLTAAGWSTTQTTTNKRQYQQATGGNSGATGCSLWVDDTANGAGGAKEARCTGFETMTGLGTGTGQWPTGAQINLGTTPNGCMILRKSTTADTTVRPWWCVANGHSLYFLADPGDGFGSCPFFFGDFFSYHATDRYAIRIAGRNVENSIQAVTGTSPIESLTTGSGTTTSGAFFNSYVDRAYTGVGGSQAVCSIFDNSPMTQIYNTSSMGYNGTPADFPYPNPADGACHVSPVTVWTTGGATKRGYMPGMWAPQHNQPFNNGDTLTASGGNLNGKSFIALNVQEWVFNNVSGVGQLLIEYSDTWN